MTVKEIKAVLQHIAYLASEYNYALSKDNTQEAVEHENTLIDYKRMILNMGTHIELVKLDIETECSIYDYVACIIIETRGKHYVYGSCSFNMKIDDKLNEYTLEYIKDLKNVVIV